MVPPMIHQRFGSWMWIKRCALLLALLATGTAAFDCSSGRSNPAADDLFGNVGVKLELAPGVEIDTVQYLVSGINGFTRSGSFDVSQSTTINVLIGGLPTPNSYLLTLTAKAVDGGVSCLGSSTFDISPHFTTVTTVHMLCKTARAGGSVLVNGTLNSCPVIDSVSATSSNDGIAFAATASDIDNGPGPLSFHWDLLSGPGALESADGANVKLVCSSAGNVTVRLTVSDGDPSPTCPDVFQAAAFCPGPTSGFPGICTPRTATCVKCEAINCPHDPTGCPGNCMAQPACGDYGPPEEVSLCDSVLTCIRKTNCVAGGVVSCYCGSATVAQCEGGAGNGACRNQIEQGLRTTDPNAILLNFTNVSLPGGGALSLGQCDHDNCGDPALGGANECVPFCGGIDVLPDAGTPPTDASTPPTDVSTTADAQGDAAVDTGALVCFPPRDPSICTDCENFNCPHDPTGCPGGCSIQPACEDYSPSDQPLCRAVLSCIRTTNCVAGGVTSCYCGTASLSVCFNGGGNGACRSQIEAGLKTTNPSTILLNLTNVILPGGGALSLGQCDHDNCGSPAAGGHNECVPFCGPIDVIDNIDAGAPPGPDAFTAPGPDAADATPPPDAQDASVAPDVAGDVTSTQICPAPLHDSGAVCSDCEQLNCPHDPAFQPACDDYTTPGDPALCTAVLTCIRTSNCVAAGVTSCYCGTASLSACVAGNGNGACRSVIEAGQKSTNASSILLNLTNVTLPAGGALSLGQCDHDNCGTPANGGNNECIPYCK
jgi:hypothetical protein